MQQRSLKLRRGGEWYVTPPKTEKSIRSIALTPGIVKGYRVFADWRVTGQRLPETVAGPHFVAFVILMLKNVAEVLAESCWY